VARTDVKLSRTPRSRAKADIAPPEPDLTPRELIARARAMVPALRARQAEVEATGNVSAETNAELIHHGFYRTVQPRRFGGYEFDVPTFYRVMMEVSRGCSETGWVCALTAGHPLLAAYFPEDGQRDVYGAGGEFRCPAAFNPPGTASPAKDGFRVSGSWPSASGIDLATHFMTMAAEPSDDPAKPKRVLLLILSPDQYRTVDDWQVMGMRGTGSKRVVAEDVFVPMHRTIETSGPGAAANVIPRGPSIYENPMYSGRVGAFLIGEATAVAVGSARGALELYEDVLQNKRGPFPPFAERHREGEFQQYYGQALGLVSSAEAILLRAGEEYMEFTREEGEGGAPFDLAREQRLLLIEERAIRMAWEAVDLIYRTAGTSASVKEGQPIGRIFRNFAAINTHPALQLGRTELNAARTRFGLQATPQGR
jgi:3-hydroxy-9,10-secoandrosta-1,3,5(10)-triene-9,17-dione monooxygenase